MFYYIGTVFNQALLSKLHAKPRVLTEHQITEEFKCWACARAAMWVKCKWGPFGFPSCGKHGREGMGILFWSLGSLCGSAVWRPLWEACGHCALQRDGLGDLTRHMGSLPPSLLCFTGRNLPRNTRLCPAADSLTKCIQTAGQHPERLCESRPRCDDSEEGLNTHVLAGGSHGLMWVPTRYLPWFENAKSTFTLHILPALTPTQILCVDREWK